MSKFILLLYCVISLPSLYGQNIPDYVKTPEAIANKMLDIISGGIDEPRDWDMYRSLFLPTAQKIIVNPMAKQLSRKVRTMNIEEFIRYVGPQYKKHGFEEVTIGMTVNEFNGVANVFQSYHAKNLTGTYEKKGINSYQLVYFDERWWIASTTWADESPEHKIPTKYLKGSSARKK